MVPVQQGGVLEVSLRNSTLLLAAVQLVAPLHQVVYLAHQLIQLSQGLLRSLIRIHVETGTHSQRHFLQQIGNLVQSVLFSTKRTGRKCAWPADCCPRTYILTHPHFWLTQRPDTWSVSAHVTVQQSVYIVSACWHSELS